MQINDQAGPPSTEDSGRIAEHFLRIAERVADDDNDAAAGLLADYFADDLSTDDHSKRLWYLAAVGPVLIAAAMKKLNAGRALPPDAMWSIAPMGGTLDPDLLAAIQAVNAHLNDDDAAARDVTAAHFRVVADKLGWRAAHDAMLATVVHYARIFATLIRRGALDEIGRRL